MKKINYDNRLIVATPETFNDKRLADLSCAIISNALFPLSA